MLHHMAEVLLLIKTSMPDFEMLIRYSSIYTLPCRPISGQLNVAVLCHIWQMSMNETADLVLFLASRGLCARRSLTFPRSCRATSALTPNELCPLYYRHLLHQISQKYQHFFLTVIWSLTFTISALLPINQRFLQTAFN